MPSEEDYQTKKNTFFLIVLHHFGGHHHHMTSVQTMHEIGGETAFLMPRVRGPVRVFELQFHGLQPRPDLLCQRLKVRLANRKPDRRNPTTLLLFSY